MFLPDLFWRTIPLEMLIGFVKVDSIHDDSKCYCRKLVHPYTPRTLRREIAREDKS
jgi:hypothetical protein